MSQTCVSEVTDEGKECLPARVTTRTPRGSADDEQTELMITSAEVAVVLLSVFLVRLPAGLHGRRCFGSFLSPLSLHRQLFLHLTTLTLDHHQ